MRPLRSCGTRYGDHSRYGDHLCWAADDPRRSGVITPRWGWGDRPGLGGWADHAVVAEWWGHRGGVGSASAGAAAGDGNVRRKATSATMPPRKSMMSALLRPAAS